MSPPYRNARQDLRAADGQAAPRRHPQAVRWLVTGQVVATNPAHAVRGPKHVVKTGKTAVLDGDQARKLLNSIDTSTLVGLRDRALISVMTFAFALIGAVVATRVEDYYPEGKRWWAGSTKKAASGTRRGLWGRRNPPGTDVTTLRI
ncbi:hypothetical protein [Methylocapsa palsarum]|uniref:Uncharacterized protein n=1 Tax=Methylocapsa palsarum TaxID=1612308 RepID=A0A1I4B6H0_9HYPH|nr:hypothetical protein [Methylocapsa palsarum]SFK63747.1 hypothetical protein SAMN05444581_11322 [Methylocapsa palsarum]